ncbi:unnamed protein product [Effrenium voratum]|nr:unnamed protein product [Effrenium voratum]
MMPAGQSITRACSRPKAQSGPDRSPQEAEQQKGGRQRRVQSRVGQRSKANAQREALARPAPAGPTGRKPAFACKAWHGSRARRDQLLQRVFTLLQKLTAVRRRQLLQEGFTQAQRKALETWALTQSPRPKAPKPRPAPRAPGPKRRAAPSTAPGAGPRNSATRGIASFHRNGQVYHQVSVCVQTLCMTARKVKDLSKALDILMILMEIKQQVKRMDAPDAFVQGMTNSVPTILREHEVTAEELGLRFQVMMGMRFWVRPPLHTPQEARVEDALRAWYRLTSFRSPMGQGGPGALPGWISTSFRRGGTPSGGCIWTFWRKQAAAELPMGDAWIPWKRRGSRDGFREDCAFRSARFAMDSLSQLPGAALCRILSFATAVDWARSATAHRHLRLDVDCLLAESGLAETRSLGEAARRGDVNVVLARLRQGADPNQRDSQHPKYTPLHRATSGGHRALVRLLLKEKADVLLRDRLGFSALHFAANQSLGIVGDLLEARADVNAANLQQMTPLHSAAGMGRVDLCELLLQAGALGSAAAAASPAELARRAALRRPGEKREELAGPGRAAGGAGGNQGCVLALRERATVRAAQRRAVASLPG